MISDYFKIAIRTLIERKTRSLLTILGIFIAILTIFVLMSLSLGLNNYVNEQFEILGTDKFFIQPKGGLGGISESTAKLTIEDVEKIEKIKGIEEVTYISYETGKIEFKDKSRFYYIIGLPSESKKMDLLFKAMNLEVDEGRFIKEGDSNKILIGYNYKYKKLFEKPVRTGNKLEINGVEFEVIGVLESIGNSQDDQQVYISIEDFQKLYGKDEEIDLIWVQIKQNEDLEKIAEATKKELMDFRNVEEETIDFTVSTPEELLDSFKNILNILLVFLVGIGSISLIIGGIGVANTMYTSVLERKKEIGTMKAIGAKNSDILLLFVIESGLLGLVGGIVGLIGGISIAKIIEYIIRVLIGSDMLRASMNIYLIVGVLLFAFLIGVLSGLTPSYQASKLKPIEALRYE